MNSNYVYILGAGFSAPANIPIQKRIIKEITRPFLEDSFINYDDDKISVNFLKSYINMGRYLVSYYTNYDLKNIDKLLNAINNKKNIEILKDENLFKQLSLAAEEIRLQISKISVSISLEDIFTSFDKSFSEKEFINNYSFNQSDVVKNSLVKLFCYYFSKSTKSFSYDCNDYNLFISDVKKHKNVTILTTNWDVLLEEYFSKKRIKYNLCLNEKYSFRKGDVLTSKGINLIKLHGSINWFRCRNCGNLLICDNEECGDFLFNDNVKERCFVCNCNSSGEDLLIPEIVTPTMLKPYSAQLYLNLWSSAKYNISKAKEINFIGYSLPVADYDFRYMLRSNIRSNVKINVILSESDKPNKNNYWLMPETRYKELFPKNDISFYYNGFGDYFRK